MGSLILTLMLWSIHNIMRIYTERVCRFGSERSLKLPISVYNMLQILCLKTTSMSKLRNPRCNEAVAAGFGVTEYLYPM